MRCLALLACFGFIVLSGQRVEACRCAIVGKLVSSESVQEVKGAVFYGKVMDVKEIRHYSLNQSFRLEYEITFKVERIWKGADLSEVKVITGQSPSCGVSYETGRNYLVLAHDLNGALRVTKCTSPTRPSKLEEVVDRLGEGRAPDAKDSL